MRSVDPTIESLLCTIGAPHLQAHDTGDAAFLHAARQAFKRWAARGGHADKGGDLETFQSVSSAMDALAAGLLPHARKPAVRPLPFEQARPHQAPHGQTRGDRSTGWRHCGGFQGGGGDRPSGGGHGGNASDDEACFEQAEAALWLAWTVRMFELLLVGGFVGKIISRRAEEDAEDNAQAERLRQIKHLQLVGAQLNAAAALVAQRNRSETEQLHSERGANAVVPPRFSADLQRPARLRSNQAMLLATGR